MIDHDRMSRLARVVIAGVFLSVLGACGDLIVDGRTLQVDATGSVSGTIRLDQNGDGVLGGSDPAYPGVRLRLWTAGGAAVFDTVSADEEGEFAFPVVPVGEYLIDIDPASVPDSVQALAEASETFTVEPGKTFVTSFGLAFPEFSLSDARALPPGRRIFTRGIVLNVRNTPGDGVVHIREDGTYLRIIQVPSMTLAIGDSVRVRGRTAVSVGQPVLEDPAIFRLGLSDQLVLPLEVTSAAAAGGGNLDAALVRIRDAEILAAAPNFDGHLVVTANDGSGPVEVVLRNFINFNLGQIVPGTTQFSVATGVLRPVQDGGGVRWQIFPRAQGDLTVVAIPPPPSPEAP